MNADDTCAGVFTVSTDQSHWRHEIVSWDSTGFAIVPPLRGILAMSLFRPEQT